MRPLALIAIAAALVAAPASAASPRAKVLIRTTSVGAVLVDARGHTLYSFAADTGKTSTCYGACNAAWHPLLTASKPLAGSGVKLTLLGMTKRKDGKLQVTYAGHPLYLYAAETGAAELKGQGIGGLWWALAASGKKVTSKPSPTTQPPPTSTTPGYGAPGGDGYR
jgi:predicted lipoprotein with Yx(FWY)xxD motif